VWGRESMLAPPTTPPIEGRKRVHPQAHSHDQLMGEFKRVVTADLFPVRGPMTRGPASG